MEKKLVSSGQLTMILNQRIRPHAEAQGCRVTSISPMMNANPDQPNWSSNVSFVCTGGSRERAMPVIRRIAAKAQQEYNLVPPK